MVLSMSAISSPLRRPRERVNSTSIEVPAKAARTVAIDGWLKECAGQGISAASPSDRMVGGPPDTISRAARICDAVSRPAVRSAIRDRKRGRAMRRRVAGMRR